MPSVNNTEIKINKEYRVLCRYCYIRMVNYADFFLPQLYMKLYYVYAYGLIAILKRFFIIVLLNNNNNKRVKTLKRSFNK